MNKRLIMYNFRSLWRDGSVAHVFSMDQVLFVPLVAKKHLRIQINFLLQKKVQQTYQLSTPKSPQKTWAPSNQSKKHIKNQSPPVTAMFFFLAGSRKHTHHSHAISKLGPVEFPTLEISPSSDSHGLLSWEAKPSEGIAAWKISIFLSCWNAFV